MMFERNFPPFKLILFSFLLLLVTSFSALAQDVESADDGITCEDGFAAVTGLYCDNYQTTCTVCNTCGDIYVGGDEECDDNADNDALKKCTPECTKTFCGDELVQSPNGFDITEECDLGAGNSNTGTCSADCQITKCGDGFTQAPNGEGETEECDAGADNDDRGECSSSCIITTCGDGFLQEPNGEGVTEQCDGTEFATGLALETHICKADCSAEERNADFKLERFLQPIGDDVPADYLITPEDFPGTEFEPYDQFKVIYKLTNTGNVNLKNVAVTDDSGETITIFSNGNGDEILNPGEIWDYHAGPITALDPGIFETNPDVEAYDIDLNTLVPFDKMESGYFCDSKDGTNDVFCTIDIAKFYYHVQPKAAYEIRIFVKDGDGNLLPTDVAPGAELQSFTNVSLVYKVVNIGNLDLDASGLTITDDTGKTITQIDKGNGDDTLNVGEEWVYETDTFEVIHPDNYEVNVTVGGLAISPHAFDFTDLVDPVLTDPVTTTGYYFIAENPEFTITTYIKKGDGDWVPTDNLDGFILVPGDEVSIRYDVENTGNLPISNIVITDSEYGVLGDDLLVDKGNDDDILDLQEIWQYVRGPITVGDDGIDITVTGTGETPDGTEITTTTEIDIPLSDCLWIARHATWSRRANSVNTSIWHEEAATRDQIDTYVDVPGCIVSKLETHCGNDYYNDLNNIKHSYMDNSAKATAKAANERGEGGIRVFGVCRNGWQSMKEGYMNSNCEYIENTDQYAICGFVGSAYTPLALIFDEEAAANAGERVVEFSLNPNKDSVTLWRGSGAAPLVVYDPANTGVVKSATQLFGNWTFGGKSNGYVAPVSLNSFKGATPWENGYAALATLDLDEDGMVSGDELKDLSLWFDYNQDAVSDQGEVVRLQEAGVTALYYHDPLEVSGTEDLQIPIGFDMKVNGEKISGRSVDWMGEQFDDAVQAGDALRAMQAAYQIATVGEDKSFKPHAVDPENFAKDLSGQWVWVFDNDEKNNHPGIFAIEQDAKGNVSGFNYVEALLDENKTDAYSGVKALPLNGQVAKGETGLELTINVKEPSRTGETVSQVEVNADGTVMRGRSKQKLNNEGKVTILEYGWVARRIS